TPAPPTPSTPTNPRRTADTPPTHEIPRGTPDSSLALQKEQELPQRLRRLRQLLLVVRLNRSVNPLVQRNNLLHIVRVHLPQQPSRPLQQLLRLPARGQFGRRLFDLFHLLDRPLDVHHIPFVLFAEVRLARLPKLRQPPPRRVDLRRRLA